MSLLDFVFRRQSSEFCAICNNNILLRTTEKLVITREKNLKSLSLISAIIQQLNFHLHVLKVQTTRELDLNKSESEHFGGHRRQEEKVLKCRGKSEQKS